MLLKKLNFAKWRKYNYDIISEYNEISEHLLEHWPLASTCQETSLSSSGFDIPNDDCLNQNVLTHKIVAKKLKPLPSKKDADDKGGSNK